MAKLTIDNRDIEVQDGATILDAAEKVGIEIPTMCFLKGCDPSTSCMVCVVKVEGTNSLVPACAAIVRDGMKVQSECPEVRQARMAALELLLSDHLGDCMGPCQVGCPATMDIGLMIRQIKAGKLAEAIVTIKRDIALPAILGRICPAPCQKVCRRNSFDDCVSICLLKRYAADVDLRSAKPYMPVCKPANGKKVAIIGAGPAGLAAGYHLAQRGYACTIFDDHEKPGGMLQYEIGRGELPQDILDKEIGLVFKSGVRFKGQSKIDGAGFDGLRRDFDAVFAAVGPIEPDDAKCFGLESGPKGIAADNKTYQTNLPGVFAGGDAVRNRKLAIRALADGKEAAFAIDQFLTGEEVTGPAKPFNSRIGKIGPDGIEDFMQGVSTEARVDPTEDDGGLTGEQARLEAGRCMHCDCRKPDDCKLRIYAQSHGARAGRYSGERKAFTRQDDHAEIIFEPGKCIDCGLCIQIAAQAKEKLGLTYIGRGFSVEVSVPFGGTIAEGLRETAGQCAKVCPTGALALKQQDQP